jgi:hypothetical protein
MLNISFIPTIEFPYSTGDPLLMMPSPMSWQLTFLGCCAVAGSKSQQILTPVRARSIWNFLALVAKARDMPVDFSDPLDVTPVCQGTSENDAASDCCLSLAQRDISA